jgi:hypothetical protein
MGTVGILAVLLGVTSEARRLLQRRQHFRALAEAHASRRYDYGEGRGDLCFSDKSYEGNRLKEDFSRHLDRFCDHWAILERKYREAASHPWREIGPDPPPPAYP